MACHDLRPAWRVRQPDIKRKTLIQDAQDNSITFNRPGSQIDPDYQIPCGKCEGCIAQKRMDWATRMYHESLSYDRNSFLTLTYEEAPPELSKHHFQKFIKRLRKASEWNLRYFGCGEYGEHTRRPHYHAIIFGEDFRGAAYAINDQLWSNAYLQKIWSEDKDHTGGLVSVGDFSIASASYVAGYVNKKLDDPDTFNLMSRRPPIGYFYAMAHQEELRNAEHCIINGQKRPIPAVYFKWYDPTSWRPYRIDLDSVTRDANCYTTVEEQTGKAINAAAKRQHRKTEVI